MTGTNPNTVKRIFRKLLKGPFSAETPGEVGAVDYLWARSVVETRSESKWEMRHIGREIQRIQVVRTIATLKPDKRSWLEEVEAAEERSRRTFAESPWG